MMQGHEEFEVETDGAEELPMPFWSEAGGGGIGFRLYNPHQEAGDEQQTEEGQTDQPLHRHRYARSSHNSQPRRTTDKIVSGSACWYACAGPEASS